MHSNITEFLPRFLFNSKIMSDLPPAYSSSSILFNLSAASLLKSSYPFIWMNLLATIYREIKVFLRAVLVKSAAIKVLYLEVIAYLSLNSFRSSSIISIPTTAADSYYLSSKFFVLSGCVWRVLMKFFVIPSNEGIDEDNFSILSRTSDGISGKLSFIDF